MKRNLSGKQPLALLKSGLAILVEKPIILFPFTIVVFIQLLIFEFLFFSTRTPLVNFFGQIIRRLAGEAYLHYPFNFLFISNFFQNNILQGFLFAIVNVFAIGVAISIINEINADRPIHLSNLFHKVRRMYLHLFTAGIIIVSTMYGLSALHGLIIKRALLIKSVSGKFFILKQIVLTTAPYINLLLAVLVTTLFVFVIPIIVLEKKKIFSALLMNFKILWGNFLYTFFVLLIPALLFVPIILLRNNMPVIQKYIIPEIWIWIPIVGILLSIFVDAIQYLVVTTFYLLRKEER